MIIKAKVLSTKQEKKGLTTLEIVTSEIEDNIDWVGAIVHIKKADYETKEVEEKF